MQHLQNSISLYSVLTSNICLLYVRGLTKTGKLWAEQLDSELKPTGELSKTK